MIRVKIEYAGINRNQYGQPTKPLFSLEKKTVYFFGVVIYQILKTVV